MDGDKLDSRLLATRFQNMADHLRDKYALLVWSKLSGHEIKPEDLRHFLNNLRNNESVFQIPGCHTMARGTFADGKPQLGYLPTTFTNPNYPSTAKDFVDTTQKHIEALTLNSRRHSHHELDMATKSFLRFSIEWLFLNFLRLLLLPYVWLEGSPSDTNRNSIFDGQHGVTFRGMLNAIDADLAAINHDYHATQASVNNNTYQIYQDNGDGTFSATRRPK